MKKQLTNIVFSKYMQNLVIRNSANPHISWRCVLCKTLHTRDTFSRFICSKFFKSFTFSLPCLENRPFLKQKESLYITAGEEKELLSGRGSAARMKVSRMQSCGICHSTIPDSCVQVFEIFSFSVEKWTNMGSKKCQCK